MTCWGFVRVGGVRFKGVSLLMLINEFVCSSSYPENVLLFYSAEDKQSSLINADDDDDGGLSGINQWMTDKNIRTRP